MADEIERSPRKWRLCGLNDISITQAQALQQKLASAPPILDLDSLAQISDVVVEAAAVTAVPPIIEFAEKYRRKVVIVSVGALLIYPGITEKIKNGDAEVYLPSGALAGLDALKSARHEDIEQVQLTTRKPSLSIAGAKYLEEKGINLAEIDSPTIVFEGNASEAVAAFPKNINVAAAVSLAGIGPQKTKVILEVSPSYTTNSHELKVSGTFGSFTARTENISFPQNPKTSFLAALSTLETIFSLVNPLKVGN